MAKAASSAGKSGRVRGATGKGAKRPKPVAMPSYQAAVKYLYDRMDVERARASRVDPAIFKLDRMRAILDALENPHEDLKCVHVGGTNGKGSVVAMVTSCLRACGYTVGTYTSPHLVDLRERVTINGHVIPHGQFVDVMSRVAGAIESLPSKLGEATFFEVITALAFEHFAEQAVDVAVIEVGLGGRLDSTNVIVPEVAAVTGIGLDHTQFLGDTVEKIAEQKAGIFKKGVPALTFEQESKILAVLRRVAGEVGAPFAVVGQDIDFSYRFESNPQLGPHMRVGVSHGGRGYEHVPVPLPGEHQAMNCGLALAIVSALGGRGFELPEAKVTAGLEQTKIPGRMEMAWKQPRVLLDGAHNPMALGALVKSIGANVPYDSMVVIFGCAADKDVDELLKQLARGADKVIFTKAKNNPRACDPKELNRRFGEQSGKMSQVAETLEEALSIAVRAAGREDLICITGSFYLVGEAKKLLADRAAKQAPAG